MKRMIGSTLQWPSTIWAQCVSWGGIASIYWSPRASNIFLQLHYDDLGAAQMWCALPLLSPTAPHALIKLLPCRKYTILCGVLQTTSCETYVFANTVFWIFVLVTYFLSCASALPAVECTQSFVSWCSSHCDVTVLVFAAVCRRQSELVM